MPMRAKLQGGHVIDGSGAPAFRADVAVEGDRITAVGDLAALEAGTTIDCTGRIVAPGFIDIHSHSDWLVPGAECGTLVEPFIRQGMTTIVGGNCGFSPAPITERSRRAAGEASRLIVDDEIALRWETMDEFLGALEAAGVPLNVAELVGHGSVRAAVTGPLEPAAPGPDELATMERLVRESLDAGCVGVSTGLGYPPGIFAGEAELAAFAGWAAAARKLLTSHLRAYSWMSPVYATDPTATPHNVQAIEEILRAEGVDVAFDAFPYTAGNTTASVLFPPEILPHLEQVLLDPAMMENLHALAAQVFGQIGFSLDDIQIMRANAPAFDRWNGLFIPEAAARAGMEPFEFYGRMVVESRRNARVLIHTYSGGGDEEAALRAVLAHPLCTIETDTFLTADGHQNPASFGTFPRVLHTYVRAGLFSLEEAIRKMTGAAAERLGWTDRGVVRRGAAADLVVLDPSRLRDTATFEAPASFPTGIEHVLVNGVHVLDGDRYAAGAKAGRVLRG